MALIGRWLFESMYKDLFEEVTGLFIQVTADTGSTVYYTTFSANR